ncbi:isocitrate/isopropylmalate dehydrogenase family protein [Vibrio apostichopi]|uniref:isocitrate/isopropylmalate dehydrogenase family protein n=1 Tax=Vibrio apostichopi TaxID=3035453 RepID=UPI002573943B|nr:isocitrate/isopropylmalate dehydrogenase family protein [Vibrio sp. FE10]
MKKIQILVLPGDGIGQEVCDTTLPILNKLNLPIELSYGDIGWRCWEKEGNTVPEETWSQIRQSDAVLLGAVTSKGKFEAEKALPISLQGKGHPYISPVIQLRQKLGLYANIRPIRYVTGDRKPFNLCVIRENTEGLYAGFDYLGIPEHAQGWLIHENLTYHGPDQAAWSVRLQTRYGLERLFEQAFNYAIKHSMRRVTFADKPNVMRESGQFAKEIFFDIADRYPSIEADIHNVDAVALWLVKKPHEFGVIVAENMFGDILSDLAAGVMGGLGLAPSANVGSDIAYFEPVHGSAPKMAGKNKANPCAMFLTIALMLEYLGFNTEAARVEKAVKHVMRERKQISYDFGGSASTREVAEAVIRSLTDKQTSNRAALITIGDELLAGKCVNTNLTDLSKILVNNGYEVANQSVCADSSSDIEESLNRLIGDTDLVVVCGGLGPTSDDRTRYAIAKACGQPLVHNEPTWQYIQKRLNGFGVPVDESNRVQALFPEHSKILENTRGTAAGFSLSLNNTHIIVLPGPPSEATAILQNAIYPRDCVQNARKRCQWMLLGISESEAGSVIEQHLASYHGDIHYLWKYPYVQIEALFDESNEPPQSVIDDLEGILKTFLVSRDHTTAGEKLAVATAFIQWSGEDEKLQNLVEQWGGNSVGEPQAAIHLTLAPPLQEISDKKQYQGVATLRCVTSEGESSDIHFPCRGPEIELFIQEYAAWFALKQINQREVLPC